MHQANPGVSYRKLSSDRYKLSDNPNSVNPFVPVNRERSRDSAILVGVGPGNERSWTLTWQEETNNSGRRLTRNPIKRGI